MSQKCKGNLKNRQFAWLKYDEYVNLHVFHLNALTRSEYTCSSMAQLQ